MKRAASLARQVAVQTGTAIVVTKDEKIIRRTAAELMTESLPDTNKPAAL
jgi:hypothetical protein